MTVPQPVIVRLRRGVVIPAHPLALTERRALDERHMRALTRYYIDAGAGGIAVGVHTTQFEIREPRYDLYGPVLELAAETAQQVLDDISKSLEEQHREERSAPEAEPPPLAP